MNPSDTASLQGIVSLVTIAISFVEIAVVLAATVLAIRELRENTRARKLDSMDCVFQYVSAEDIRQARKRLQCIELPVELGTMSDGQIRDIELVLSRWARVGVLLQQGVFSVRDEESLCLAYSGIIDAFWEQVKRYVACKRETSGMPDYYRHVEILAKRARAWRCEHGYPVWPYEYRAREQDADGGQKQ